MEHRLKWYQDGQGNTSTMRIIAVLSAVIGSLLAVAGAVALFLGISEGVGLAGIGAGMASAGELSKAWQAQNEVKTLYRSFLLLFLSAFLLGPLLNVCAETPQDASLPNVEGQSQGSPQLNSARESARQLGDGLARAVERANRAGDYRGRAQILIDGIREAGRLADTLAGNGNGGAQED
jgi:hypothetical protein